MINELIQMKHFTYLFSVSSPVLNISNDVLWKKNWSGPNWSAVFL